MPLNVSVVIPVRDEARSIDGLLDSLCSQTRLPDEVLICDAGSTDGTVERIEKYLQCMPVRVLSVGPAFPGRARNVGIQAARHNVIALTDAGIRLDPEWLDRLVAPFEGPFAPDVVYGRFEPVTDSFRQRCIALAFVPPPNRNSGLRTSSLASMAMDRRVWDRVGGFREDLRSAEDLLFMRGIAKAGFSVQYQQHAVAFWNPPRDFTSTFRRFTAYSRSNIRAGLAGEWQIPLIRTYAMTALLTLSVLWTHWGGVAPLVMLGARAVKRAVGEMGVSAMLHIPTLAGSALALAIIDVATFCGCCQWLVFDRPLDYGTAPQTQNAMRQ